MSDDDRVAGILGKWQERCDRGEEVDPEDVIAEHPDLADELRAKFEALEALDATRAGESRSASPTRLRELPLDRYADFRPAGEGGMGIVYWAIDTDLNREVAFKVIRPGVHEADATTPAAPVELSAPAKDTPASQAFETLKQRFLQEAWVTGGLSHPGIVPVYELGQTPEGVPYYTMRFVKGERTLADAIEEVKGKDIEERLKLLEPFLKVCDTLSYAHAKGVIHRDLKPDNIALGEFGEVVVIDWGLAKIKDRPDVAHERWQDRIQEYREATDLRTVASAMGTPGYMAPEAAKGQADRMDARSDVYSLGAILFQILTGRLPFEFTTFGELVMKVLKEDPPAALEVAEGVSEALSDLCARCLGREPGDRPKDADEIAKAVRAWQARSAVGREIEGLLRDGESALAAANEREGDARIQELDRVVACCSRILALRHDHTRARELQEEVAQLREEGTRERERAARRRTFVRMGLAALVLLLVGAGVAVGLVESARQQEASERQRADRGEQHARTQLQRARALALAGQSTVALESDAQVALQLAREALTVEATCETRSSVLAALLATQPIAESDASWNAQFAPDGGCLATIRDGAVLQILSADGRPLREWSLQPDDLAGADLERFPGRMLLLWSPDSRKILTCFYRGMAKLWSIEGEHLGDFAIQMQDRSSTAVFGPRGERILSFAWNEGAARLWDVRGSELGSFAVAKDAKGLVPLFAPDGSMVLSAEGDVVVLRDREGVVRARLEGHRRPVGGVSFSADGARMVTFAPGGDSFVWDARTHERIRQLATRGTPSIVSWASRKGVHLVDLGRGQYEVRDIEARPLGRLTLGVQDTHEGVVYREQVVAWSPVATHFVTQVYREGDARIALWDVSGHLIHSMTLRSSLSTVNPTFSPTGREILVVDAELEHLRCATVLDVEGRELLRIPKASEGSHDVSWSPNGHHVLLKDGKSLAVYSTDANPLSTYPRQGMLNWFAASRTFDRTLDWSGYDEEPAQIRDGSGARLGQLQGSDFFEFTVFSADGNRILTGADADSGYAIVLHDGTGRKLRRFVAPAAEGDLLGIQLSLSGRLVLAVREGAAHIWEADGRLVATLEHEEGDPVSAARISPDEQHVFTAASSELRIWTVSGNLLHKVLAVNEVKGEEGYIQQAVWSPRGDCLATQDTERIRVWSRAGALVAEMKPDGEHVYDIRFLPSGAGIVGQWGRDVRIWGIDGRLQTVLPGHIGDVQSFELSPSATYVAVASADYSVQLWTTTGEKLFDLPPSEQYIKLLRFLPDEKTLVVVREKSIWHVPIDPESQIEVASRHCIRDLTEQERRRYADLLPPEDER